MRKRQGTTDEKRLFSLTEAANYIGMGKNRTRTYMDEIGATVFFGRRVLFDRKKIDLALDELTAYNQDKAIRGCFYGQKGEQ